MWEVTKNNVKMTYPMMNSYMFLNHPLFSLSSSWEHCSGCSRLLRFFYHTLLLDQNQLLEAEESLPRLEIYSPITIDTNNNHISTNKHEAYGPHCLHSQQTVPLL